MFKLKNIACLLLISFVILFSGCSAGKSSSMGTTNGASYSANTQDTAGITDSTNKSTATKSTTAASEQQISRKIVKTATLSVETLTYDKTISKLDSLVDQYSGYVENSTTQGQGLKNTAQTRTAQYTIRIPSDKLDDFLNSVGSIGNITSKTIKGEDITQTYFDKESRLTALKIQQTTLQDMLKKSGNLDDLIKINNSLTDVNTQIEQLTGELQKLSSLVDLSTVNVTINEVAQITKITDKSDNSFGGQVLSVLTGSLNALLIVFKVIIEIIVAILPFVIVFGAIALVIIFLVKFFKRRKTK
jgi:hypothetical protein